jgi:putative component of membrane protein insertase Oxa1/YidC/SpoIIIJ protein YidD
MKLVLTLLTGLWLSVVAADLRSPENFSRITSTEEEIYTGVMNPAYSAIRFYQIFISPVKQENCPMYPSCSHYGLSSIKEYGLTGILMTADRLHRCGHDLHKYERIFTLERIYFYDPPEK